MAKTRILIADGMEADSVEQLKANPDFEVDLRKATPLNELTGIIGGFECIVIRSATKLTKDLIEKAKAMKLIVRAGAGVDNIDVPTATQCKIPVMNTASANSLAAAEQTIALMFAMLRQLPQACTTLREGKWDRASFKGYEATGKTMGVIGIGNIGRLVAEKALGLGMKVVAFDPVIKSSPNAGIKLKSSIDEVIKEADILTIHVPKSPATAKLINAGKIAMMKNGSFLLNCARGGIVDEKAVIEAVDSGKLTSAAFDVYEKEPPEFPNPLFNHPKIVCAPHLGASTVEAQKRVGMTAAKQILGFFKEGDRTGIIN